ncbi:MAG TPA: Phenylacetic acid catabolic protein, partial [Vicinamibacteria bacterium]|nr:Phenylacetic acid catabolic protein [Vicinamibacteria bacterium]
QQRNLLETSPSDYDTDSSCRIMVEEMRHGWQMCHLLVNHFGETGKIEARKLLERRSWQNNRLLGSFNVDVDNWVDFFTYTEFVDRDGKFQLNMLSTSGFAPLARSMGPMLREEGFHLGTGHMGLQRIVKAGKLPAPVLQKYINKWLSTAFDLFGKDSSSSAEWFYVWGVKGRYDEAKQSAEPDKAHLNELSRDLYRQEVDKLLESISRLLPAGAAPFVAPDLKFHRAIGEFAGKTYSVTGEELSVEDYAKHAAEVLPNEQEKAFVRALMKEPDWIAPRTEITTS